MYKYIPFLTVITLSIIVFGITGYQYIAQKEETVRPETYQTKDASDSASIVPSLEPINTDTNQKISEQLTPQIPTPTSAKKVNLNNNSLVKLESVNPTSGIQGQQIVLRGQSFGPQAGNVWFYTPEGTNSGGPTIDSWNDNEIHIKVGFILRGGRTFYIEVQTSDGKRSNKVAFEVKAGQPYIASISPSILTRNSQITIQGTEFGTTQGSINFYLAGSQSWNETIAGSATINSWTDTNISFTIPSSLENKEYGMQIITSDGRTTSVKYITVGN